MAVDRRPGAVNPRGQRVDVEGIDSVTRDEIRRRGIDPLGGRSATVIAHEPVTANDHPVSPPRREISPRSSQSETKYASCLSISAGPRPAVRRPTTWRFTSGFQLRARPVDAAQPGTSALTNGGARRAGSVSSCSTTSSFRIRIRSTRGCTPTDRSTRSAIPGSTRCAAGMRSTTSSPGPRTSRRT